MTDQKTIQRVRELGSDWIGEQVVRLGDYSDTVETGTPGRYFARQNNGQVIEVLNTIHVPPDFDLRVLVRRSRSQPNLWQITETLQDYDDPAESGRLAYHHEQHEEKGPDRLTLDRKQIKQLSVRVKEAYQVKVYGGAVQSAAGIALINNQTLNLASYVPTSGGKAKYVSIEADEDGNLSLNDGAEFDAPNIGTEADIPVPDAGKYGIAYVLLYHGQSAILDEHIRAVLPLPGASSLLLVWGAITGTLSDQTDLQAALDLKLEDAPIDGEIYGRQNGDWEIIVTSSEGGAGHNHGLMRWAGASGETVFDLPDLAAYIESVTLNGLEEDPIVYTLSADGSQITLDTALASDTTVIAHYVLLNL